jgi:S1-C subfamily serine protease
VWWKSNYDYLRRILKGTPAKPVIDDILERENNRYNVDYVEWFQEYLAGGYRHPWVSRIIDSSALGVASSVRDQRVLQSLGTNSSSSFARKPLQELFSNLAPSVPVVEAVGKGTGSGFLVELEGRDLVITNRHVVENASDGVAVHFINSTRDGEESKFTVPAERTTVVAIHKTADLALVDVSRSANEIRQFGIKSLSENLRGS